MTNEVTNSNISTKVRIKHDEWGNKRGHLFRTVSNHNQVACTGRVDGLLKDAYEDTFTNGSSSATTTVHRNDKHSVQHFWFFCRKRAGLPRYKHSSIFIKRIKPVDRVVELYDQWIVQERVVEVIWSSPRGYYLYLNIFQLFQLFQNLKLNLNLD